MYTKVYSNCNKICSFSAHLKLASDHKRYTLCPGLNWDIQFCYIQVGNAQNWEELVILVPDLIILDIKENINDPKTAITIDFKIWFITLSHSVKYNVASIIQNILLFHIMYLLRFSKRIDHMKNPYGNFFIQSQSRNVFPTHGKNFSSNPKLAVKMNQSILQHIHVHAPLQSSCTAEVFRVSKSFHQFSHELAINHQQQWKIKTGKYLGVKKENNFKKTRQRK